MSTVLNTSIDIIYRCVYVYIFVSKRPADNWKLKIKAAIHNTICLINSWHKRKTVSSINIIHQNKYTVKENQYLDIKTVHFENVIKYISFVEQGFPA